MVPEHGIYVKQTSHNANPRPKALMCINSTHYTLKKMKAIDAKRRQYRHQIKTLSPKPRPSSISILSIVVLPGLTICVTTLPATSFSTV